MSEDMTPPWTKLSQVRNSLRRSIFTFAREAHVEDILNPGLDDITATGADCSSYGLCCQHLSYRPKHLDAESATLHGGRNMGNVRVVTDTIAQVPAEVAKEYMVEVVPAATAVCDGKVLTDGVDLTLQVAYDCLARNPRGWLTSAISPRYFASVFDKLAESTSDVVCVTVSSKLSAVYNVATIAAEQAMNDRHGLRVWVVDSLSAAGGEGLISLAAARAAMEGKSIDEVVSAAESARSRTHCMFVFDTIKFVYRTGRVPKIVGEAGDRLGVRPIARIGQDGKVHFVTLSRSRAKGVEQIMKTLRESDGYKPVDAVVVHTAAAADAEALKARVEGEFECRSIFVSEFSPIMGYATGPGVLGVAVCSLV